jgi:hypothetical protein
MKQLTESPKQYSARRVRVALECAKAAVLDVQEELTTFRGNPADYQQLTDAALTKLDAAWLLAAQREQRERERVLERAK